MNNFALDFKEGTPIYYQLYNYIISEIGLGRLAEDEKLPSKRVLSANLGISQNTVDSAYQMLAAEGYVISRPKSGFYVCRLDGLTGQPPTHAPIPPPPPAVKAIKYNFTTGNVDATLFPFKTWARISRDVMAYGDNLLNHGDRQGDLPLRQAIATYLHEFRGVNCDPAQVVVGAGMEYLVGLLAQLLGKDAIIGVENPGYAKIYQILRNNNLKTRLIPLDLKGIAPNFLQNSGCTAAYITPSHQFPTGITMPVGRRLELLNWSSRADGRYIIEDDYDSEFRFDGRPIPALQGLGTGNSAVYLSTFSKSLAPSIRIAYMVLPLPLLQLYRRDCAFYSSTVSRFEQHTLARFLDEGHFARHINRVRNLYRGRKDALVWALKGEFGDGIDILHENTGLHLPAIFKMGMCESEIISRASAAGIALTGLSAFDLSGGAPQSPATIIFGYSGLQDEEIRQGIKALGKSLVQ